MRTGRFILACVLCGALLLTLGRAPVASAAEPTPAVGSKQWQLRLKQALESKGTSGLLAELNHNKQVWGSLSPEELRELRNRYYAFLKEDPDRQINLLEAAEAFQELPERHKALFNERAVWLSKVVASLTPEEKKELKAMSPADRAKRLLELKAKLSISQPASAPAASAE